MADDGANASLRTYRGGLLLRPDDGNPERVTLDDQLTPLPNVNVGDHYSGPTVGIMASESRFASLIRSWRVRRAAASRDPVNA